jgi:hypothetical protein
LGLRLGAGGRRPRPRCEERVVGQQRTEFVWMRIGALLLKRGGGISSLVPIVRHLPQSCREDRDGRRFSGGMQRFLPFSPHGERTRALAGRRKPASPAPFTPHLYMYITTLGLRTVFPGIFSMF